MTIHTMNLDSRMTLQHNVFAHEIMLYWEGQYIGVLQYKPLQREWQSSFSVPNVTQYAKFWKDKDGASLMLRILRYIQMNVPA